jgi:TatD DNase family protein
MSVPDPGPPIVDTHLHLDEPAFDADRDEVLAEARRVGVSRFINIAHVPARWGSSRALRLRHRDVDVVVGLHPQHADAFDTALGQQLEAAMHDLRAVAVGETGFDFFRSGPPVAAQERAFRAQLDIALNASLPVVIHQRDASEMLIAVLDDYPRLASIVLHSFDGTDRLTDWALARGCYIGIGGLATKPGSAALRERLRRVPPGRLLLETDAPYLVPPAAASKRNVPANLPRLAALLAPLWDLAADDLRRITTANARAAFGDLRPPPKMDHRPTTWVATAPPKGVP